MAKKLLNLPSGDISGVSAALGAWVAMWEHVHRRKRPNFMMLGAQAVLEHLASLESDLESNANARPEGQDMRGRGSRTKRSCKVASKLVPSESSTWAIHYRRMKTCYDCGAIPPKDAALWRRRFRVPFGAFLKICEMAREAGVGPRSSQDACGTPCKPLELKVMGVLRVLGRAHCFDDCAEMSGIDGETHRQFFHEFCHKFTHRFWDDYVHPPQTEQEIEEVLQIYSVNGLPGTVGSVDCVHVPWAMAPHHQKSWFVGKEVRFCVRRELRVCNGCVSDVQCDFERCFLNKLESRTHPNTDSSFCTRQKFPSVVFEVVSDHARRVLASTAAFPGTCNDKTTVKFDGFVQAMHRSSKYQDVVFKIYADDEKGVCCPT